MSYLKSMKFLLLEDEASDRLDFGGGDSGGDDGGFDLPGDESGESDDGLDLGGDDGGGDDTGGDDGIFGDSGDSESDADPEAAAEEVIDILNNVDKSLNRLGAISAPLDFNSNMSIKKSLAKSKMKSFMIEGPWDSAEKKAEDFKEKLELIKKPYEEFFNAKKDMDIDRIAEKAANMYMNFDSTVDKYEIVKYFAELEITLNGPNEPSELKSVISEFEAKMQTIIKEEGGELANSEYTIDNPKDKIATGATSSGG